MGVYRDESKAGYWRYRKQVKNRITGEIKNLNKRGFSSKKQAQLAEAKAITDFINRTTNSCLPFEEIIADFLEYHQKRNSSRTVERYERIINRYILPQFVGQDMVLFNVMSARKFQDYLIEMNASNKTKNEIIARFKAIFKFAENMHNLNNRSYNHLWTFKVQSNSHHEVYNMIEFKKFDQTFDCSDANDLAFRVFFNIVFCCGLRRGEAKGLQWADINFDQKIISVTKQFIDKDPIHGRLCTDLKTEQSNRRIILDNITIELLKRLKEVKRKKKRFSEDNYVFEGKEKGVPFSDNAIAHRNRKHAKMAGLKHITIHGYRHSFASVNYAMGTDIKTISVNMGHKNITTTFNCYVNMIHSEDVKRVDRFNQLRNEMYISDQV